MEAPSRTLCAAVWPTNKHGLLNNKTKIPGKAAPERKRKRRPFEVFFSSGQYVWKRTMLKIEGLQNDQDGTMGMEI
jgi:hypothetical protein